MNATISQATNRAEVMTHNFGGNKKIRHNGFDLRLEDGALVGWYPTKKEALQEARELGLTIK